MGSPPDPPVQPIRREKRPGDVTTMAASREVVGAEVRGGPLAELYLAHADRARRLAYLLTGDQATAEDLVQDAFIRLAGRLAHLRDPGAFEAYLRRTVVNLSNSHFRHRRVERAHLDRQGGSSEAGVEPAAAFDARDALWSALGTLSDRQRAAIVLRYYEDLPDARIAEVLGCRIGTVKSLVSRGLDALREEIHRD
jgi:RNA polymerase sigma-70 factor (sigma-E family)